MEASVPRVMNGILCDVIKDSVGVRSVQREKFINLLRKKFDIKKSYFSLFNEYNKLINNPDVRGVEVTEDNIIVYTNEIHLRYTDGAGYGHHGDIPNGYYNMGYYKIVLEPGCYGGNIKIFNMAGYKMNDFGIEIEHPHVYKGDGGVCWGYEASEALFELLRNGLIFASFCYSIKFLRTCNMGGACGSIRFFPKIRDLD